MSICSIGSSALPLPARRLVGAAALAATAAQRAAEDAALSRGLAIAETSAAALTGAQQNIADAVALIGTANQHAADAGEQRLAALDLRDDALDFDDDEYARALTAALDADTAADAALRAAADAAADANSATTSAAAAANYILALAQQADAAAAAAKINADAVLRANNAAYSAAEYARILDTPEARAYAADAQAYADALAPASDAALAAERAANNRDALTADAPTGPASDARNNAAAAAVAAAAAARAAIDALLHAADLAADRADIDADAYVDAPTTFSSANLAYQKHMLAESSAADAAEIASDDVHPRLLDAQAALGDAQAASALARAELSSYAAALPHVVDAADAADAALDALRLAKQPTEDARTAANSAATAAADARTAANTLHSQLADAQTAASAAVQAAAAIAAAADAAASAAAKARARLNALLAALLPLLPDLDDDLDDLDLDGADDRADAAQARALHAQTNSAAAALVVAPTTSAAAVADKAAKDDADHAKDPDATDADDRADDAESDLAAAVLAATGALAAAASAKKHLADLAIAAAAAGGAYVDLPTTFTDTLGYGAEAERQHGYASDAADAAETGADDALRAKNECTNTATPAARAASDLALDPAADLAAANTHAAAARTAANSALVAAQDAAQADSDAAAAALLCAAAAKSADDAAKALARAVSTARSAAATALDTAAAMDLAATAAEDAAQYAEQLAARPDAPDAAATDAATARSLATQLRTAATPAGQNAAAAAAAVAPETSAAAIAVGDANAFAANAKLKDDDAQDDAQQAHTDAAAAAASAADAVFYAVRAYAHAADLADAAYAAALLLYVEAPDSFDASNSALDEYNKAAAAAGSLASLAGTIAAQRLLANAAAATAATQRGYAEDAAATTATAALAAAAAAAAADDAIDALGAIHALADPLVDPADPATLAGTLAAVLNAAGTASANAQTAATALQRKFNDAQSAAADAKTAASALGGLAAATSLAAAAAENLLGAADDAGVVVDTGPAAAAAALDATALAAAARSKANQRSSDADAANLRADTAVDVVADDTSPAAIAVSAANANAADADDADDAADADATDARNDARDVAAAAADAVSDAVRAAECTITLADNSTAPKESFYLDAPTTFSATNSALAEYNAANAVAGTAAAKYALVAPRVQTAADAAAAAASYKTTALATVTYAAAATAAENVQTQCSVAVNQYEPSNTDAQAARSAATTVRTAASAADSAATTVAGALSGAQSLAATRTATAEFMTGAADAATTAADAVDDLLLRLTAFDDAFDAADAAALDALAQDFADRTLPVAAALDQRATGAAANAASATNVVLATTSAAAIAVSAAAQNALDADALADTEESNAGLAEGKAAAVAGSVAAALRDVLLAHAHTANLAAAAANSGYTTAPTSFDASNAAHAEYQKAFTAVSDVSSAAATIGNYLSPATTAASQAHTARLTAENAASTFVVAADAAADAQIASLAAAAALAALGNSASSCSTANSEYARAAAAARTAANSLNTKLGTAQGVAATAVSQAAAVKLAYDAADAAATAAETAAAHAAAPTAPPPTSAAVAATARADANSASSASSAANSNSVAAAAAVAATGSAAATALAAALDDATNAENLRVGTFTVSAAAATAATSAGTIGTSASNASADATAASAAVALRAEAAPRMQAWFDAAPAAAALLNAAGAPAAEGEAVFTWQDKSGRENHLRNAGGADAGAANRNVAYTVAGYGRAVDTSGGGGAANTQTQTGFRTAAGAAAPVFTNSVCVFAVTACIVSAGAGAGAGGGIVAKGNGVLDAYGTTRVRGNQVTAPAAAATANYNTITNAGAYTATVSSGNAGAPVCFALTFGAPAAAAFGEYINGNDNGGGTNVLSVVPAVGAAPWTDRSTAPLCLATRADAATWSFRRLFEVLVYDMPVSDAMRKAIEGYLMWKWKLQASLPAGHPYKTGRPVVSAQTGAADFVPPKTAALFQQPVAFVDLRTLPRLKAWYDAADGSTLLSAANTPAADGQAVFTWRDKSDFGYHMTNVGGPNVGTGNRNIANTAGYGRMVDTSGKSFAGGAANTKDNTGFSTGTGNAPLIAHDITVFVVSSCLVGLGDSGYGALVSKTKTASSAPFDIYGTTRARGTGASSATVTANYNTATNAGSYTTAVASGNVGAPVCFALTFGAPAAGTVYEYINGNTVGTSFAISGAAWANAADAPLCLATRADKGSWTFRHMYEVLVYDMPLTTEMRQAIEGYLMWKWKLQASLPAGHPYKTGKPVVSALAGAADFVPPKSADEYLKPVAYDRKPLPNLKAWYDAADENTLLNSSGTPATAGQSVFTWRDKSDFDYHMYNMGGSAAGANNHNILYTTSYGRAVDTSGRGATTTNLNTQNYTGFTTTAGSDSTTPVFKNSVTIFAVFSSIVGAGGSTSTPTCVSKFSSNGIVIDMYSTFRSRGSTAGSSRVFYTSPFDIAAGAFGTKVNSAAPPACVAFVYGAPSATAYSEFANGSQVLTNSPFTNTNGASVPWSDTASAPLCLATHANTTNWAFQHLYEVLVYDMPVSTDMRQAIEGYLMWKWKMQNRMPADHPYQNSRPIVATTGADFAPPKTEADFVKPTLDPRVKPRLKAWYDAADGSTLLNAAGTPVADGESVFTWRDKTDLQYHMTNVGGPGAGTDNRNIANTTSYGRMVDTGGQSFTGGTVNTQNNTGFTTGADSPQFLYDLTIFVVSTAITTSGVGCIISKTKQSNSFPAPFAIFSTSRSRGNGTSNTSGTANYNASTNSGTYTSTVLAGLPVCLATAYGQPSATTVTENINGNANDTFSIVGVSWANDTTAQLCLTTNTSKTYWSFRHMYEVLVYDMPVSTEMRQAIEGYLMWKWKMQASLPATHPYKNGKPVVSQASGVDFTPPNTVDDYQKPVAYVDPRLTLQALKAWYDAADGSTLLNAANAPVADGESVFTWRDKSDLDYHMINVGGPLAGTSNRNIANTTVYGRMVDTGGQSFTGGTANAAAQIGFTAGVNSPLFNNNVTIFAVTSCIVGGTNYGTIVYKAKSTAYAPFGIFSVYRGRGNGTTTAQNVSNYNVTNNAGTVLSGVAPPVCFGFFYGAPTASTFSEYINAGNVNTYAVTGSWGNSIEAPLCLCTANTSYYSHRYMYEVLIYDMPISSDMRLAIEGYLMWKWNMQVNLPSGHTYKTGRPVNAVTGADFLPPKTVALYQQPVAAAAASTVVTGLAFKDPNGFTVASRTVYVFVNSNPLIISGTGSSVAVASASGSITFTCTTQIVVYAVCVAGGGGSGINDQGTTGGGGGGGGECKTVAVTFPAGTHTITTTVGGGGRKARADTWTANSPAGSGGIGSYGSESSFVALSLTYSAIRGCPGGPNYNMSSSIQGAYGGGGGPTYANVAPKTNISGTNGLVKNAGGSAPYSKSSSYAGGGGGGAGGNGANGSVNNGGAGGSQIGSSTFNTALRFSTQQFFSGGGNGAKDYETNNKSTTYGDGGSAGYSNGYYGCGGNGVIIFSFPVAGLVP